jgi:hypothetical protein
MSDGSRTVSHTLVGWNYLSSIIKTKPYFMHFMFLKGPHNVEWVSDLIRCVHLTSQIALSWYSNDGCWCTCYGRGTEGGIGVTPSKPCPPLFVLCLELLLYFSKPQFPYVWGESLWPLPPSGPRKILLEPLAWCQAWEGTLLLGLCSHHCVTPWVGSQSYARERRKSGYSPLKATNREGIPSTTSVFTFSPPLVWHQTVTLQCPKLRVERMIQGGETKGA